MYDSGSLRNREALPHADTAVAILIPTTVSAYARDLRQEALSLQSRLHAAEQRSDPAAMDDARSK